MKNLIELYDEHNGKSSDKWDIYLHTYHQYLSSSRMSVKNFLEIGVQNGGSLEIWREYFPVAENIIGCDINPDCEKLKYNDEAIKIVIGNSSTEDVKARIQDIAQSFDLIIDDGSHDSSDIIKSFLLYFPLVNEEGIYIVEDLHCSYWQNFEGGLYDPFSSMAFLKKLADVQNHEHWGIALSAEEFFRPFYQHYDCETLGSIDYSTIHSVTFLNSLCIIQKGKAKSNLLGVRHVVGDDELVVQGNKAHNGTFMPAMPQDGNFWSSLQTHPEMEWKKLVVAEQNLTKEILVQQQQINDLQQRLKGQDKHIRALEDSLMHFNQASQEKDQLIQCLSFDNQALLASTSWRITKPMRSAVLNIRRAKKAAKIITEVTKTHGVAYTYKKGMAVFKREGISGAIQRIRHVAAFQSMQSVRVQKTLPAISRESSKTLSLRVLIVAELSIPQCRKYRVEQKVELFKKLNVPVTVLNWHDIQACIDALQSHSLIIFYRVPAFDSVNRIFDECDRLNLPTYWEVDDLIFDAEVMRNSRTLNELDKDVFQGLLDGAHLYHSAMLRCKFAIASTPHLAEEMEAAGVQRAFVVENALDPETVVTASALPEIRKSREDDIIRIVYGSGTSTHNVDFLEASDAILSILKKHKNVHFRLIGTLELPKEYDVVQGQIERIEFCPYTDYLKILNECDISIAPLENYVFNDSKSNIKYIEASILGIPCICSPRPNFSNIISHGENGFLCDGTEQWVEAIEKLVDSVELRHSVGMQGKQTVLARYSQEFIAENQVKTLVDDFKRPGETAKKKILSVNCYYGPRSFGGATVVAEALNKRLNSHEQFDIHVFTALNEEYGQLNTLRRYEFDGQDCYGMVIPDALSSKKQIVNHDIDTEFSHVLDLVQPDLVHFHSIQGLGVTMLDICHERKIPIVVTAHDYWWLYENQFILSFDEKHKFRGLSKILDSTGLIENHDDYYQMKKRNSLKLATVILAPSLFTSEVYKREGFDNVLLNKNGIAAPASERLRLARRPLRFGYVGGNTNIKGFHLIKQVFADIPASQACLIIVDNTLNLGFPSFNAHDLEGINSFNVVPAFTQDEIDEFYAGIDVLLYPTQSKESFGLTVREALIRDVWVITSDAGGAAEDIIVGENGLVIPFNNDSKDLHQAVSETIEHFAKRDPSAPVTLPHSHIRSFDEQCEELSTIYLDILK
ncbi:glycosyltransferase [Klebsiella spallanzanii]|uniref:glycosyltransferase n=1 Tax=Klebsiella spallanzanii TaxID=2587528 RepID=UPI00115858A2|nr:glycosyltransferase [Klebsiella spallanzanii]VUT02501.1 8-demethyl-8-alpha-L-rhamnosyl tetracenomycin-C 2'-O-methyltransferase [Klebsiella spallanzanii]